MLTPAVSISIRKSQDMRALKKSVECFLEDYFPQFIWEKPFKIRNYLLNIASYCGMLNAIAKSFN